LPFEAAMPRGKGKRGNSPPFARTKVAAPMVLPEPSAAAA